MKHTEEEIINALKIIKDECSAAHCQSCPFGDTKMINDTCCKLQRTSPRGLEINDIPPHIWRALK